jgi:protein O-GlcNAc transferase
MATLDTNLAQALEHHRAGRLAEAEGLYRAILEAFPQHPDALHLLGVIALQAGQPAAAVDLITRAMAGTATVEMLFHLGSAQRALGDLEAARVSYSRAVGMNGEHASSLNALGEVLLSGGFARQAEDLFRAALKADPGMAEAGNNLGHLLKETGRLDEAIAALEPVVRAFPDFVGALNNLGVAYYERGRLGEAIAAFERCLQLAPALPHVHNNLGNVLQALGDMRRAAEHYRHTLSGFDASQIEINARVLSNLLMCAQYTPGATAATLYRAHQEWQIAIETRVADRRPPLVVDRSPDRRLKLGFVAPHWGLHPVTYLTGGVMAHLDRNQFEVIWYLDIFRPELGAGYDHIPADRVVDTAGWPDDRLLRQMRADGIDIAFDLAGHSGQNRLVAFAERLAPVQIGWAGYPGTTGLSAMDYLLSDRWQVRPGEEEWYSEAILRMPNGYVIYAPPKTAPAVGPTPFRRNGFITFGCFNNPGKINAPLAAQWAKVLHAIPTSKLLLKYRWIDDPLSRARLDALFAGVGIAPERLIIEGISPQVEMMARYNDVDVALDCQPFGGGVTTLEALWMGAPVVALNGATAAGRHAYCHVMAAGFPDLAAETPDDWVALAIALAQDPDRLDRCRAELRPRLESGPVCNGVAFAAAAGDLFRRAWRRYAAGLSPCHLDAPEIDSLED